MTYIILCNIIEKLGFEYTGNRNKRTVYEDHSKTILISVTECNVELYCCARIIKQDFTDVNVNAVPCIIGNIVDWLNMVNSMLDSLEANYHG